MSAIATEVVSVLRGKAGMSEPTIAKEHIDQDAQKVVRHLVRNNFQAYLVGGCVRDLLLGRTPKDFDVATSATPSEVRDLFRNCRIIGRRFRLAHVVFGRKIIETATFRANPREEEGVPENGDLLIERDNVFGTAEEDARRRDFTINGLFYDIAPGQVIDYVGGLADLAQRSVRTIGDPSIRFREDPVRMLRAVKFAARLGLDIEDETYRAIYNHRSELQKSAVPRVLEEIFRLLRGGAAVESLVLLRELGLIHELLPEISGRLEEDPGSLDLYLERVDSGVQAGDMPSNALLLILMFLPELRPLLPMLEDVSLPKSKDPSDYIDEVIGPLCARLRVPRRDVEQVKLILFAQRRIYHARKRGSRLSGAMQQRHSFAEALALHGLLYRAQRQQDGASPAQIDAEIAAWPFGAFSLLSGAPLVLATDADDASVAAGVADPSVVPSATSSTAALGSGPDARRKRRRRRRRSDAADGSGLQQRVQGDVDSDEDDLPADADEAGEPETTAPALLSRDRDDDEPIPEEEAVLAAFAAAMSRSSNDD